MSTPKKTETKPQSDKAKLTEEGKKLAKLKADEAKAKLAAMKKPATKTVVDKSPAVIPPAKAIVPAKGDVGEIMKRCLEVSADHRFVTSIRVDTTKEEYLAIFDDFQGQGECWQLRLGSLIHHGQTLKAFGGEEHFAAAMAASGRGLDSCKAYLSTYVNTPPALLKLGIPYTALRHTVKVRDPEKKETLIKEIAAAEKSGEPMTVDEVKKKADKLAPKKKTATQKARVYLTLTDDQKSMLKDLEALVSPVADVVKDYGWLSDAKASDTAKLRGMLEGIVKFAGKLEG